MQKLYYYFEGGMGDVIIQFYENRHFKALADFRSQTCSYVRAVLNVHNPQAVELFRHETGIDDIQYIPFQPDARAQVWELLRQQGYRPASDLIGAREGSPAFRLSATDRTYLEAVLPKTPYIAAHLGAGKRSMSLFEQVNLRQLTEAADRRGAHLVLIGGSSARTSINRGGELLVERATPNHAATVNLIDAANPRLASEIVVRSAGFIGSLSCYVWVAAANSVAGLCIIEDQFHDDYVDRVARGGISILKFGEVENSPQFYDRLVSKILDRA